MWARNAAHPNDLLAGANGVAWMVLTFYVPLLWVSIVLVAWLLVTRRAATAG